MRSIKLMAAVASLAAAATAQILVVPPGFANAEGNSNNAFPWNRGSNSMRIEYIYDSTSFTTQGVTSPIVITRMRFRSDGTTSPTSWTGGTYQQVQIDMSTSPVDFLAASNTFANNHGPDQTTVLNGPVTIQGGTRTNPGPWHIDIPLTTPFLYDPTSGSDLTLDIRLFGNTFSGGTLCQADHNSGANTLGTRIYDSTSGNPNSTSGNIGTNYAAIIEFTYGPAQGFASVRPYGAGCYDAASSFYELFSSSAPFDLSNTAFLMQNTGGGGYAVLPNPTPSFFTPTSPNLGLTDDSVSAAITLPFPMVTPAGVRTQIAISSNGFIWTAPNTVNGCCNGASGLLLSQAERFAPYWVDLNPSSGGTVHYDVDPAGGAVYVTFQGVPEFGTANLNTFQVAIFASGGVEYRYQSCAMTNHTLLVGWSGGNGARDPGAVDLSTAIPFVTSLDSTPIALAASARPVIGTNFNLITNNIPASTPAGAIILSLTQVTPGIDLGAFGAPGCLRHLNLDSVSIFLVGGPSASSPLAIPANNALAGAHVYAQSATFSPGLNAVGLLTTNGLDMLLDIN